ncbi:MAG: hypothetical protein QM729_03810 [Solirubrobacterales bacterium]
MGLEKVGAAISSLERAGRIGELIGSVVLHLERERLHASEPALGVAPHVEIP